MKVLRSAALVAVLSLSLGLGVGISAPSVARAAGCLAGTYCGSLTLTIWGQGTGTWLTTDAAGAPDGVMSCTHLASIDTTCNHRFEWDRTTTRTIYWKAQPAPNSAVAIAATGSLVLTANQTTSTGITFNYLVPITLKVGRIGPGTVTSNPPGISCGEVCIWTFDGSGANTITVTALPDPGFVIATYSASGATCGSPPSVTCTLAKRSAQTFDVQFLPIPSPAGTAIPTPPTPTVAPTPAASPVRTANAAVATPSPTKKSGKAGGTSNLETAGDSNPIGGAALLVVAAVAIGSLFWIGRSRRKAG